MKNPGITLLMRAREPMVIAAKLLMIANFK
jgi:hypothetical protein